MQWKLQCSPNRLAGRNVPAIQVLANFIFFVTNLCLDRCRGIQSISTRQLYFGPVTSFVNVLVKVLHRMDGRAHLSTNMAVEPPQCSPAIRHHSCVGHHLAFVHVVVLPSRRDNAPPPVHWIAIFVLGGVILKSKWEPKFASTPLIQTSIGTTVYHVLQHNIVQHIVRWWHLNAITFLELKE